MPKNPKFIFRIWAKVSRGFMGCARGGARRSFYDGKKPEACPPGKIGELQHGAILQVRRGAVALGCASLTHPTP
jgi:hypothetical protein